jgi:NAD(P)-dependent dehydrogenase (short-subunit alcohol dehydrogenase family)/acyl carrier protein
VAPAGASSANQDRGPGGGEDLALECARALSARGARVVTARAAGHATRPELAALLGEALAGAPQAAHGSPDDADQAGADDGPPAVAGVVSLLALDEAPAAGTGDMVPAGLAGTLVLVQALGDLQADAPLWVLTRGAVAIPGEAPASPAQAQVWGLGRVAALEHPQRWGGLVDLPPQPGERQVLDERVAARLCGVLTGCGEDQVAVRTAGVFARRLERAPRPRTAREWQPAGTVLVTGGTGALGGHVARWLAGRGAPSVVLASRSGPAAPGTPAQAAGLAEAGTAVQVIACDSADRTALAGLLSRIPLDGPPLTGVFHAAGSGLGGAVEQVTVPDLAAVLAAKAAGAAHLDELTAGQDLDAFVLFSSIAATWGSGLQAAYAAANAALDALAESRRSRGLAATSVAWGLWGGSGMGDGEAGTQLRRLGLRQMAPDLAIGALAQVLDGDEGLVTVADVDWARFAPVFALRRPSPLIGALPEVGRALAAASTAGDAQAGERAREDLTRRLAELPRAGQQRLLTDLVRAEAATVLGHASPDAVGPDRAFRDLGFESYAAVELRGRLAAATGLPLPATLVFDYPTPAGLAQYLRAGLVPALSDQSADEGEAEIRKVIAAIPLNLLRNAGLLDSILELAHSGDGAPGPELDTDSIKTMDVADLIKAARGRAGKDD